MQSGKVTNHPLTVVLFPVQRRLPMLRVDPFPTGCMPPAKVLIAAVLNEFEVIANTHRRAIDREVFQENLVCGLLVIPRERWERRHPCLRSTGTPPGAFYALPHGRATAPPRVPKLKQSAFDLNHPAHFF